PDMVPPWDTALRERWYQQQRDYWNEQRRERETERARQDRAWWRRYHAHLNSPAWQAIRAKVLARAEGRCEGCGERHAREVHHLTYEHMGHEFLFELVALCSPCHRRLHPESADEPTLVLSQPT